MTSQLSLTRTNTFTDTSLLTFVHGKKSRQLVAHIAQIILGCIALGVAIDQVTNTKAQVIVTATPLPLLRGSHTGRRMLNVSFGAALAGVACVTAIVVIGSLQYCKRRDILPRWQPQIARGSVMGNAALITGKIAIGSLVFLGLSYLTARFVYDPVGEKAESFFGWSVEDKTLLGARVCVVAIWFSVAVYAAVRSALHHLANSRSPRIA